MRSALRLCSLGVATLLGPLTPATPPAHAQDGILEIGKACLEMAGDGLRDLPAARADRFLGKVKEPTARCRGGERAVKQRGVPWVDWSNYWGNGDATSKTDKPDRGITLLGRHLLDRNTRGLDGALLDLEYQRMELIKFNLFDNLTYETYVKGGRDKGKAVDGPVVQNLEGNAACAESSKHRERGDEERRAAVQRPCYPLPHRERHLQRHQQSGDGLDGHAVCPQRAVRIDLSGPWPQRARAQPPRRAHLAAQAGPAGDQPQAVHARPEGRRGLQQGPRHRSQQHLRLPEGSVLQRDCGVLDPVHDARLVHPHGGGAQRQGAHDLAQHGLHHRAREQRRAADPAAARRRARLPPGRQDGSRTGRGRPAAADVHLEGRERQDQHALEAVTQDDPQLQHRLVGRVSDLRLRRQIAAPDAARSRAIAQSSRWFRRTPAPQGDAFGYLPTFETSDPIQPEWEGQEAVAMPDNWSIGLSFLHNVFVREHNVFVERIPQGGKGNARGGFRPASPRQADRHHQVQGHRP